LLRGVFLKERELKRAKERAKNISDENMEKLLPILKKNHEKEIEQLSGRQLKVVEIMKGTRLN
jgi:hypothetical protein